MILGLELAEAVLLLVLYFWDFRDALRRKSLCFFRHILRIREQK